MSCRAANKSQRDRVKQRIFDPGWLLTFVARDLVRATGLPCIFHRYPMSGRVSLWCSLRHAEHLYIGAAPA